MQHTETEVHVFWDHPNAPETYSVHTNLTYHQLNYQLFTEMLGDCSAFFGTAGIEAVCEALYLGKPVLVVPAHGEQELNAGYASQAGVLTAESFNLDPLLERVSQPVHNNNFKEWADRAEDFFIHHLGELSGE